MSLGHWHIGCDLKRNHKSLSQQVLLLILPRLLSCCFPAVVNFGHCSLKSPSAGWNVELSVANRWRLIYIALTWRLKSHRSNFCLWVLFKFKSLKCGVQCLWLYLVSCVGVLQKYLTLQSCLYPVLIQCHRKGNTPLSWAQGRVVHQNLDTITFLSSL